MIDEAAKSLEARRIRKRYGSALVVAVDELVVPAGSITALIGPSGSGKSTLLRLLTLIENASEGEVAIDGETYDAVKGPGRKVIWPDVSLVFPKLFLWPHMTLRQNIELPLEHASAVADRHIADKKRFTELVDRLHMADVIDRFPNQTSDGQRQRAALIRAVMLRPRYLLLDEVTSWLDVEHIATVGAILCEMSGAGTGILLATHHIGFARRFADRVLFMQNGLIVSQGGPELFDNPEDEALRQFLLAL